VLAILRVGLFTPVPPRVEAVVFGRLNVPVADSGSIFPLPSASTAVFADAEARPEVAVAAVVVFPEPEAAFSVNPSVPL
jgi:hypothetical protein